MTVLYLAGTTNPVSLAAIFSCYATVPHTPHMTTLKFADQGYLYSLYLFLFTLHMFCIKTGFKDFG